MADFLTRFMFLVPIADRSTAEQLAAELNEIIEDRAGSEDNGPHPIFDYAESIGLDISVGDDSIIIRDDAGEGSAAAAAYAGMWLLEQANSDAIVTFSWANICSKPGLGVYGGGACAFSRQCVRFQSTDTVETELAASIAAR